MNRPIEKLGKFLKDRKVEGYEKTITHISMTGGKYCIPLEENEEFLQLYLDALKDGSTKFYFTECILPGKKFKLMVDIEIKHEYREKPYTDEEIKDSVFPIVLKQLIFTLNDKNKNSEDFIISRRSPCLIHINFPKSIVSLKEARSIIKETQNKMTEIYPYIKWDKSLDSSIYSSGRGLRLMGSFSKKELKEGEFPFYRPVNPNGEYGNIDMKCLKTSSIRTEIDDETMDFNVHDKDNVMYEREICNTDTIISSYIEEITENFEKGFNIITIKKIFYPSCEFPCFAVSINDRFCPFIKRQHKRNSNPLYIWITQKGAVLKCYDEDCCKKTFPEIPIKLNTTIRAEYYANADVSIIKPDIIPDGYELTEEIIEFIENCINNGNTHYDLAQFLYYLYKDIFRVDCCGKNATWYEFKNHRFFSNSNYLGIIISENFVNYFKRYKQDMCGNKNQIIDSLVKQLKTLTFKTNIITEASNIFYYNHQDFIDKKDSYNNLVCYNNGILDLYNFNFRDGVIEDCITLSTHNNYIEYDPNNSVIKEVYNFFNQLFPDTEIMEYQLKKIAICLSGSCQEEFNIWTGNGCFCPGTSIMMENGCFKNVEDIKIGDRLIGDDGSSRKVMDVFDGMDDMYKIEFSNGDDLIVNKEHKLVFESDDTFKYKITSKHIILEWQELIEGIPTKKIFKKHIGQFNYNIENIYSYMNTLLQKLKNHDYIKKGKIFTIKLKDYLNLDKKMTQYYYQPFVTNIDMNDYNSWKVSLTEGIKCSIFDSFIKEEIFFYKEEDKYLFIKGYLHYTGDKETFYKKGHYAFINKEIYKDLLYLCYSIELDITICEKKHNSGLYKIFVQKRKPKRIFEITHLGIGDYFGFELNKNSLFVGSDFGILSNSNGKSKLCLLIQKAFGDYWNESPVSLFTKPRNNSSSPSPEVMDLKGRRITTLQEPETKDRLNTGLVKHYSGNDYITSRQLHKQQEKFRLQTNFFLCCNVVPKIESSDGGTWRRFKILEFKSKFVHEPVKDHEFKIDKQLENKIKNWGPYLLSILVHYYKKYLKEGIKEPCEVKEFTSEIRRDYDIFSQFVEECLTENRDNLTSITEIQKVLSDWFEQNNIKNNIYTKTEVKKYLADLFGREIKQKKGNEIISGFKVSINSKYL